MKIRSINDVSAAVRGRRLDLGLSQSDLSERSGISRKWISVFESGKPTAEFGLVMRVLETLGLHLEVTGPPAAMLTHQDRSVDLDAFLEEYQAQ